MWWWAGMRDTGNEKNEENFMRKEICQLQLQVTIIEMLCNFERVYDNGQEQGQFGLYLDYKLLLLLLV